MRLNLNQQSQSVSSNCRAFADASAWAHFALGASRSALVALLLLLLAFAPFVTKISAQTNSSTAAKPAPSNRFLFIVDTSSSMKRHEADVLKVVNDIIMDGASGQMHPGDSLGLWTFNQDVYSDLPVQMWSGKEPEQVAMRTLEFLKKQRFGKASHLAKALADLHGVIRASDIITVFIISTGESKMVGTPFDQEINALYLQNLKDMKPHPRAVVTVLQAKGGKLIRYTVNALPWPVVIPELPISIRLVQTTPVVPVVPAAVSPKPATTSQPQTTQTTPAPLPIIAQSPATTSVASSTPVTPPPVVSTPVIPAKPAPTSAPVVTPESAPAVAATPPRIGPAPVATPNFAVPPPPTFTPPPPPSVKVEPTAAALPTQHPLVMPGARPFPRGMPPPSALAAQAPASNPVVAVVPVKTIPLPGPRPTTNSVALVPASPLAPTNATISATNGLSTRALAFVGPEVVSRPKSLLIAGLALLLIGVLLIVMMVRRSRTSSGPSLITHSMGNKKK